ncbi:MAG TPA: AAA family ATPase, partial [Paenisporosarcina sp.]|nr:AAA family ATPase [Paenisporosarcina sp.]
LLDDGRITDSQGRVVNFSNTVVILTSNIGSQYLLEGGDQAESLVMSALRSHFKPELLNRMDEIVLFHSLNESHFNAITEKYLAQLANRLKEQEISITFTPQLIDWVVLEGTDVAFGARPLRRFIQRHVETAVAKALLGGELIPGSMVEVTVENGEVEVNVN